MDPILVTTVEKESTITPLLIIDHKGVIGAALYEKVQKELTTVLVSGTLVTHSENLIFLHYKHRIPEIPNGDYSMIIFVFNREKDIHDIVKKCVAKAQEDEIPFIFIVDRSDVDEKFIEKIMEWYEESYVVITDEFFGQGDTLLDSYILQAGTTKMIKLPYMGLRETKPVLFADLIQGILQVLFGIQKRHRITYLFSHHIYTDLSIAHILQKKDPLIQIDFLKDRKKAPVEKPLTTHGTYFFEEDYPVQEKILQAYKVVASKRKKKGETYVFKEEMKPLLALEEENNEGLPEPVKKWGIIVGIYLGVTIFLPLFLLGLSWWIAVSSSNASLKSMEKGDLGAAQRNISTAHGAYSFAHFVKTPICWELSLVGLGNASETLDRSLISGQQATAAVSTMLNSEEKLQEVLQGNSRTSDADVAMIISSMRTSLSTLQSVQVSEKNNKNLQAEIGKYQSGINLLSGTINLLPHMLATQGRHTYLVLFQNNTELRSGGGLIDSYGLLSFDHGKISDMRIQKVSDADNRLHTHVDPAFGIRRYGGEMHQYVHNSNFDPDFVVDAQKASEMFHLATGQRIDGVIATDLNFITSLLTISGPITIPDQNITVTSDNFMSLVAAKNPSTSDFLHTVLVSLQNKLEAQEHINSLSLIQMTLQAIQEKHLLFAIANVTDQNRLTTSGVSSSLWDPRGVQTGVIQDYMGISDANVGNNTANFYTKRDLRQSVSLDGDGNLKGQVHVTYANNSKLGQGGDYKNYMRVLLPKDTILTGIAFDGKAQATRSAILDPMLYESKGFKAPSELEVEQTQESGKTLYGFLVTIPAGTSKTVDITYEHMQKINIGNPVLHYSLYLYKQPGTATEPIYFSFNFPLEYSILSASPANQDGSGDYTLDMPFSSDKIIDVQLTKK